MCVRSDARCRSALTPPVSGATRYRSALAPRLTTRPGPSSQVPIPPSAGACPGGAPAGGACGRTTLTRDGGRPPWRLRGRTAPGNWSHNSPARRSPSSASWLQNSPITGVKPTCIATSCNCARRCPCALECSLWMAVRTSVWIRTPAVGEAELTGLAVIRLQRWQAGAADRAGLARRRVAGVASRS